MMRPRHASHADKLGAKRVALRRMPNPWRNCWALAERLKELHELFPFTRRNNRDFIRPKSLDWMQFQK